MSIEFSISEYIPAEPHRVYEAWLSTPEHTEMTGAPAQVSDLVGGTFTAWDGYISGKNMALVPNAGITQAWRTAEFSESEPDSLLEIVFAGENGGTRVTIEHRNLPQHGMQYYQGWQDFYFAPMATYFSTS